MLEVGDLVLIKDRDEIKEDGLATTDGGTCHLFFNDDGMSRYCGKILQITRRADRVVRISEGARYTYQTIYDVKGCSTYVWAEEWLIHIGGDLFVD